MFQPVTQEELDSKWSGDVGQCDFCGRISPKSEILDPENGWSPLRDSTTENLDMVGVLCPDCIKALGDG